MVVCNEPVNKQRKVLWKNNVIRVNQTNPGLPDSKTANRVIATKRRNVRGRVAVAANKAEANRVVANRAAASSVAASRVADDKPATVN